MKEFKDALKNISKDSFDEAMNKLIKLNRCATKLNTQITWAEEADDKESFFIFMEVIEALVNEMYSILDVNINDIPLREKYENIINGATIESQGFTEDIYTSVLFNTYKKWRDV